MPTEECSSKAFYPKTLHRYLILSENTAKKKPSPKRRKKHKVEKIALSYAQ